MVRDMGARGPTAMRSLAVLGGVVATGAAVALGAVLAVFFAATVAVIAVMSSVMLALAGLALRARRTAKVRSNDIIEARHLGGHQWVAYGWKDRA